MHERSVIQRKLSFLLLQSSFNDEVMEMISVKQEAEISPNIIHHPNTSTDNEEICFQTKHSLHSPYRNPTQNKSVLSLTKFFVQ
jgi:hypothetical protein